MKQERECIPFLIKLQLLYICRLVTVGREIASGVHTTASVKYGGFNWQFS